MPAKSLSSDSKITIASLSDLHSHFDELYPDLLAAETEHTWQKIERALLHIQAITRGGATKYPEFISLLKDAADPINNALLSERTKLSGTAGDLLNSIAPRMAERFEPLVGMFVPTLLLICARTNKIAVKRAEKSLHFIVRHCRAPGVVGYLKEAVRDKSQGLRAVAVGTLVLVLECTEKERLARRVGDIEGCIKSGATDSHAEVRQLTKRLFELYVSVWPERVEQFTKPMTPTIRRYLSLPKTGALQVEIPPLMEAPARSTSHSSRLPPATTHHIVRHEEALLPTSHPPQSRTAPAYNFFPDLPKPSSSSSTASTSKPPAFAMNDPSYAKRGLFADQIAAARNARLARVPSFNFDDVSKPPAENLPSMKRQPSFDQLRSQPAAAPGATFRVPRFDVVVAPPRQDTNDGRPRSGHSNEATFMHRDINANMPSFAAASGLHGKSALLAAYKQAFVVEPPAAKTTHDRQHRDRSDKKHSDKRREKTVTVRFEPESTDRDNERALAVDSEMEALRRSKSAPSIAVQVGSDADSPTESTRPATASQNKTAEWEDSDSESDPRPHTPPERVLHTQTPRTGVKASRVPAQRVAVPSAVKVSAMRVAVPTPSAKIAAGRVVVVGQVDSVESSPVPKSKGESRTPRGKKVDAAIVPSVDTEDGQTQAADESKEVPEVKEVKKAEDLASTAKKPEPVKEKPSAPAAVKKPASATAQTSKPTAKPVAARPAPSSSVAAKARLEARSAAKPSSTTAESKKIVPKPTVSAARPVTVRKPTTTTSTKAPPASSSVNKTSKPFVSAKPTSSATASALARAKLASTAPKPSTTTTKKPAVESAPRSSTLTASTASTRNKVVPAAAVKKFQPKPAAASTAAAGAAAAATARQKSSIAASLAAKSKLVGVRAGAMGKDMAVKKAGASMAIKIERHRRMSAVAAGSGKKVAAEEQDVAVEEREMKREGTVELEAEKETEEVGEGAPVEAEKVADHSVETEAVEQQEAEKIAVMDEVVESAEPEPELEVDQAVTVSEEQDDALTPELDASTSESQLDTPDEAEHIVDETTHETDSAGSLSETISTPVKQPLPPATATLATPIRTPLSSKDHNIPKPTPLTTPSPIKPAVASPRLPASSTRSAPVLSSPLRRTTQPPVLVPVQFEPESSYEESESESDESSEQEQVVQLHFTKAKLHQVVGVGGKQLVVGLDSSDDSGRMEAGEADETVLLE
ncbi:CLASP_N domain-containing protein [Pseudozyma hubeiensis]|nr:CLASP_N domain-containing protein [Pseudozyma hubeiensis]